MSRRGALHRPAAVRADPALAVPPARALAAAAQQRGAVGDNASPAENSPQVNANRNAVAGPLPGRPRGWRIAGRGNLRLIRVHSRLLRTHLCLLLREDFVP